MAKKIKPQPAATPTTTSGAASFDWQLWALVALAFLIYATGFGNNMVAMDDHMATTDNPAVRTFSVFTNFNLGMYAPLTWLGYAIAYHIGGDKNPMWFHLLSALVHAVNVWLVLRVGRRLQLNATVALLCAFFFAIHPLQVEAISWIAAFSTPLYALFSLLALDCYIRHTDSGQSWSSYYWLAVAAFVAACLSKSAAVALPLAVLAIDGWRGRSVLQNWLEKVPFLAIAVGFGILTLISRGNAGHTNVGVGTYTAFDRVLMVAHTIWFYGFKTLLPTNLSIWYPFEKTATGGWHWTYWAAPVALVAAVAGLWWKRREWPNLWYGILFWLSNLVFALPFRTLGEFELRSDRYNYMACLGILVLLAALPQYIQKKYPDWYNRVAIGLGILVAFWAVTTFTRIRDWHDTLALIDKAIAVQGDNFGKAYMWRGMEYGDRAQKGDVARALADFTKSIERNPALTDSYKYRGALYGVIAKYDASVADLNEYLRRKPDDIEYRYNRGLSLLNLQKPKEALADFDATLAAKPDFIRAYRTRGNAYLMLGDSVKGQADLAEFERLNALEPQEGQ